MKVFITGGSGFIGRNLKEQLSERHEVFAPTSAELDLLDEEAVSGYINDNSFDVVIHSATWNATRNSTKDLSKIFENNLRMFWNVARRSGFFGKMIYYGSGAEYDRRHWRPKMEEGYFDAHVPADDYGFSKYVMAKHAEKAANIYNMRLFGVFGKYEDWEIRFISNACCKAVYGLPISIKQNVFFDYMYIDDLVRITEWFMENNPPKKAYNVCTGQAHDLLTLAGKVLNASGKGLEINVAKDGLGREYSGDNQRLLEEMGRFAFADIDEAIGGLYSWYLGNKSSIDISRLLHDK